MQRKFTSGSRQAPDPFDQFLEENNFYRKHTARDASCLFRVISEQMYDTQLHHLEIRKKCVRYMRKHRKFYQPLVDRDLDEYLDDMSKPKSYGSLIELQALGYLYHRNVVLFEPFNLGNYFGNRESFQDVFRVFYTPEHHFDSVFTCDYIKNAAICQALCYEILYKDLFKLPDVTYAVEQMLHSFTFESLGFRFEHNEEGYSTLLKLADGRSFEFDLPRNTNCILENYKLCRFHYSKFPYFSNDLPFEIKVYHGDEYENTELNKIPEPLLPHQYVSCVRQLLDEGITPFPYKVAKALDANMYRNIEFDAWNEARKEYKLQNWYNGDANFKCLKKVKKLSQKSRTRRILQVGAKCHVKLCRSENALYTCHIQEISMDKGYCVVYVEQLGERRLVPYDSLTPLPHDQFKPWSLPYRFQRHMQKYSSVRFTRQCNYRFKFNGQITTHELCGQLPHIKTDYCDGADIGMSPHYVPHHNDCYYKLKQYTHLENFRTQTVEYCTMPLTMEHSPHDFDGKPLQDEGGLSATPSNDNSRAPSRASNAVAVETEPNADAEGSANIATEGGGTAIMDNYELVPYVPGGTFPPDYEYLCPGQQYTVGSDDYYHYGYEGAMHPPIAPIANSGPVYYMCNPNTPSYTLAPNNVYVSAPPMQYTRHSFVAGPPQNPCYYHSPYPNAPPSMPMLNNSTPSYNNTTTTRGRGHPPTTPLGTRVNFDVRKSIKLNGYDLPSDTTTLRYFFNLGVEYYHKRDNDLGGGDSTNRNRECGAGEGPNMTLDENGNHQEIKPDSNNNNVPNANMQNPPNKPNYAPRRFAPRYFSAKERQSYQRNCMVANSNSSAMPPQQNRHQIDSINNNKCTKNNNNKGNTPPNANMRNQMQTSQSGGITAGMASLSVSDQSNQTSPITEYDAIVNTPGVNAVQLQAPTIYNPPHGQYVAYGSYDYGGDMNGPAGGQMGPPPHTSGGTGLYLPLPMGGGTHHGVYAGPPPPPAGMGMQHHHHHPISAGGNYQPYVGQPLPAPPTVLANMPLQGPPMPMAPSGVPLVTSTVSGDNENGGGDLYPPQIQCMGYPPPIPLFYAPPPPPTKLPQPHLNAPQLGAPQGYWCMPPNIPPIQASQPTPPQPANHLQSTGGRPANSAAGGESGGLGTQTAANSNRQPENKQPLPSNTN